MGHKNRDDVLTRYNYIIDILPQCHPPFVKTGRGFLPLTHTQIPSTTQLLINLFFFIKTACPHLWNFHKCSEAGVMVSD